MIDEYDQQNPTDQAPSTDQAETQDDLLQEESTQLNAQQVEAEEERKLYLRRWIVLGAIILAAAFYFVWSNYLNFGYLKVVGAAPFSVNVIGEKTQECQTSPCEIKLKRGEKFIAISKEGFAAESIETEVILWTKVTIKPVFKVEPYIKEVSEIPEGRVASESVKYKFVYDQAHNNYAIVKDGESTDFAVSYFGGKLSSPFLIGSENTVLAIENVASGKAFYINTITKERNSLKKTFTSATKGKVSPNGRYFLIENSSKTLFVANKEGFTTIRNSATFDNSYWTLKNTLILAYLQSEEDDEGNTTEKYIFDEYDPATGEQRTIFTSDSMLGELAPKNIKVNNVTNTIFFESGSSSETKKYEIIF